MLMSRPSFAECVLMVACQSDITSAPALDLVGNDAIPRILTALEAQLVLEHSVQETVVLAGVRSV
jgi:hypothetical protein